MNMWKLCRKTIFPRWNTRRRGYKCRNPRTEKSLQNSLLSSSNDNRKSNDGGHEKQQAHRCNGFWDDPQFRSYFVHSTLFETVGWLSTAVAFGINNKQHLFKKPHFDGECRTIQNGVDCRQSYSNIANVFYKLALAMPISTAKNALPESSIVPDFNKEEFSSNSSSKEVPNVDETLVKLQTAITTYIAESENSSVLVFLDKANHQSFLLFKASAERGCSKALFNLGLCYELGKGTTINLKKAAECYSRASHKGHSYAAYNLGVFHLQGTGGLPKNSVAGLKLLGKAADLGVSEAQVYLGVEFLEEGKLCDAFSMFSKSAKQNNVEGAYYLGMCYENGWGVVQNEKMAAEMYAQAAAKGHQDALFNLGLYNEHGRGEISKNEPFAMALYQILADMGHKNAKEALCMLQAKKGTTMCGAAEHSSNSLSHKISISTVNRRLHESMSSPDLSSISLTSLPPELHGFSKVPQFLKASKFVSYYPTAPLSQMCN